MKNCNFIRTLLPLFDSTELTAIEKRQADDHLASCTRCQEALASIRALHSDLQHADVFEPGEAMLADLRRSLRRRLRQETLRPSWQERLANLLFGNLRPAWQIGFTAATVLVGILIGRYMMSSPVPLGQSGDWLSYLTPGKVVAIESGYLAPSLANVQMIRFDPLTQQVEIHFSMVNDVQLRGSVDDPPIRQALSYALRDERQPNLRLKAIKAVGETFAVSTKAFRDDDLTEALLYALEHDPNSGVRLKAAQVFKHLPLDNTIKNTLIRALLRDENSAVRIEAIDALSRGNFNEDEMAMIHATAAADTNDYIRLQAKRLLSGELEQTMKNPSQNLIQ
jgi:anti-sigma factor RsiW